ncbi:hypothetical protein [Sphingorhabdus contaminans]|uniref:DUF4398 domain-containing protein n=1 Tax=Sphingorhabdus contaminans TaxID=1343899 RepID=A0A553WIV6_9SPHN|nr:hypothetical protein [Sphingorhabdus contaminans]TSB04564.1 hypothetical protein FOM92_03875 [Sphingorhabdus contaminans]
MRSIIIIFALVLSGCDSLPRAHSKDEIREIVRAETKNFEGASFENERRLFARVTEAEKQIKEAEEKIDDLESKVRSLETDIMLAQ